MEFIARTVPGPPVDRVTKEAAEEQLRKHPQFKEGTVVAELKEDRGRWVATLHEPKVAKPKPPRRRQAAPPPFEADTPEADAPSEEPKPDSESKSEEKPKEEKKGDKVSLEDIKGLLEQIATAVGATPPGGPEDVPDLGAGPHPEGPKDGPGPLGDGAPPHDETSTVEPGVKQIIHRKAPPGATPVGSPAFASTKEAAPRVASFDVDEAVEPDFKVSDAERELTAIYGPHGYKVAKIVEIPASKSDDNKRHIRARLSVR